MLAQGSEAQPPFERSPRARVGLETLNSPEQAAELSLTRERLWQSTAAERDRLQTTEPVRNLGNLLCGSDGG